MPKKKTNKSAAKRFKKTASGRFTFSKAGAGHLMSSKSRKRKRNLRSKGVLSKVECTRVKSVLG